MLAGREYVEGRRPRALVRGVLLLSEHGVLRRSQIMSAPGSHGSRGVRQGAGFRYSSSRRMTPAE
eukprot:7325870-Prymnesium_polylepis.1